MLSYRSRLRQRTPLVAVQLEAATHKDTSLWPGRVSLRAADGRMRR